MKHLLGFHKLVTLEIFVSLVSTTNPSAVDTPALICVVALLGPELAVVLTLGVVDSIIVHDGVLVWLSSKSTIALAFTPSVHLGLHQVAFGDHWR